MKKVSLLILCLIMLILPCSAKTVSSEDLENQPKVFIYHIPDDESIKDVFKPSENQEESQNSNASLNIVSDDITADTTGINEEIEDDIVENYDIDDMYSDVLQGYAVYEAEEEDAISLEDNLDEYQTIKIQRPTKIKGGKYVAGKITNTLPNTYSKFSNMEYTIEQKSYDAEKSFGKFSAGTEYKQKIDYAEFRQSTSLYSRYDMKYGALNTEFSKTVNSTNGDYNDYFSFAPELKLGQYFSLKETVSANFAKNIKISEFVLSINPFGNKDTDRFNIELGTSSIFDENNSLVKNRFKVTTNFKF